MKCQTWPLLNSKNFFLKMKLSQNYGTTLRKYLGFPLLSVNGLSVPFFLAIPVLVDTQECSHRSCTQRMSCIGSSSPGFQLKPFWLRIVSPCICNLQGMLLVTEPLLISFSEWERWESFRLSLKWPLSNELRSHLGPIINELFGWLRTGFPRYDERIQKANLQAITQ